MCSRLLNRRTIVINIRINQSAGFCSLTDLMNELKHDLNFVTDDINVVNISFHTIFQRVPGPGSYDKTFQSPQNGVLQKMGRQHGLFFSSAFQV